MAESSTQILHYYDSEIRRIIRIIISEYMTNQVSFNHHREAMIKGLLDDKVFLRDLKSALEEVD